MIYKQQTENITTSTGSISAGDNYTTTNGDIKTTNGTVSGGTITSTGTINAAGNITTTNGTISGATITSTGYLAATGFTRPRAPTVVGCNLGCDSAGQYAALELCAVTSAYIDCTIANTDWNGRILYTFSTAAFAWCIGSTWTAKMTLKSGGLYIGATLVSASDKRLKFNEKPLANALDMINK